MLTTPKETLTIAEPEHYIPRFSDGNRVLIAIAALAASFAREVVRAGRLCPPLRAAVVRVMAGAFRLLPFPAKAIAGSIFAHHGGTGRPAHERAT